MRRTSFPGWHELAGTSTSSHACAMQIHPQSSWTWGRLNLFIRKYCSDLPGGRTSPGHIVRKQPIYFLIEEGLHDGKVFPMASTPRQGPQVACACEYRTAVLALVTCAPHR